MNKIYNIIWSQAKEKWIVVSEKIKSNGGVPKSPLPSLALLTALLSAATPAYALDSAVLPTGGQITTGVGSIAYDNAASQLTVTQSSSKIIASWESFNIGSQAAVHFAQLNRSDVALNNIGGQSPSQIFGKLTSTGNVFLLNPSGVVFGNGAQVNVGGLVASSLSISDADFLKGSYSLQSSGAAGAVTNSGQITALKGGVVALIAPQVSNAGTITTPDGSTALAAGNQVSVDFTGDGLINLTVDSGVLNASVENSGNITAEGGLVLLTAKGAENVTQSAVNNSGIIIATALHHRDGKIVLDSNDGLTTLAGTLDVSSHDGDGGEILAVGGLIDVIDGVNPNGNELLLVAPTVANIRVHVDGVTQQLEFTPDSSHHEDGHDSCVNADKSYSGDITLGANNDYADYRVGTAATKAIIVETGDGSKVYDATTLAKNLSVNTIGVRDSGYSADGLVFTTSSKNVGSNYAIQLGSDSNQLSSDYAVGYYTGKYSITKADATVIANSKSVTYNGYEQSAKGFTVEGLVGGETAEVLAGVSAIGTGKNAGQYGVVASGEADNGNYTLTFKNGLLDIGKAEATVTADSKNVTYNGYDQGVNSFKVEGLAGDDNVELLTGVSASGTGKNAGQYNVVASGSDNNYNLTFNNGLLTIGKANATVTANSNAVTYNGAEQSVTGFTASDLVGGETEIVLTGVSASGNGTNAGHYDVVASGSDDNYNLTFNNGLLTIGKANATVTANSNAVTYNGALQSVTGFTASDLVGGETESVLTGVSASGTGKNAGQYSVVASGEDKNYNLTFNNGLLAIGKADATVTANSNTVTYNGGVQSVNGFKATGLVGGETERVLTSVSATGSGKNAGLYDVVATGKDNNYNLTFNNGLLTIYKANATVTGNSNRVTYNGKEQGLSGFKATGLVGGETESVLTGVSASGSGKNAGKYDVIAIGDDSNYNLTFKNGLLDINKADATVTGNSNTFTYNGAVQGVSGFKATGLVGGETESVLTGVSASGNGKNAGQYDVVASGSDENYNLVFNKGLLTIGKANATVTANSNAATYNGTVQSVTGFTASGLVGGEGIDVLAGVSATGSGRNAGQYDVTATGSDNNYNLTFKKGLLDIGKKSITISGITAYDKYNDGTATAVTNTTGAAGWIQGDQLLVSAGGLFENPATGTWNVALSSKYSGADVSNYAIMDQLTTTATIKAVVQPPTTAKPVDPVTVTVTAAPAVTLVSGLVIQYSTTVPAQTVTPAGGAISGEISVSVPVATLQTGASFTIPLPTDIQAAATTFGGEKATLLDGTALPSWIAYDATSKTFRVTNVGQSDLGSTVTVLLTINGQTWDIVLSTQQ